MGETRVTQSINIHGWKNAVPAGCFHFDSEIKSERMNMTVSTLGVQCGVQTRMGFKQLFFFFSPFCNSAQVMVLTTNSLKLKHIALAHIFMTTVGIPQKRWMTNCDCFY